MIYTEVVSYECVIKNYIYVIKQMNLEQNKAEKVSINAFWSRYSTNSPFQHKYFVVLCLLSWIASYILN